MTDGKHCVSCGRELSEEASEPTCPECLLPGPSAASRATTRRSRRAGVLGPGCGLVASGLMSVTLGITVHTLSWPGSNRLFTALATLSLFTGPIIVWGGWCLLRWQAPWLVRVSSLLAIVPCGFGCIVGLPAGLWALTALARPEVQAAFRYHRAEYDAEQDRILDEADADLRD